MNQFVEKYGQILLPLITPYDANEEVDYGKYAELIEYLIQNDLCDSLIVTGTTGEASLLTFDERVKLMETAVKTAAGRKPVIAGTGCASTKETIALTNKAVDLGIETCLVVCPFYNKPTQEGLYRHFKALAEATKADIMLYNIPIFVGVNLEAETVRRLAENGQIATQYVDLSGAPTMDVSFNPNGSIWAVEGITSPDGRVLGKMGHAERVGPGLYQNVPGDYELHLFDSARDYFNI